MSPINILFWLRKNQINAKGETKVYCRIQDGLSRVDFSTGVAVRSEFWHMEAKRVSVKCPRHQFINENLDRIEQRLRRIIYKLEDENAPINPEIVKNEFSGISARRKSLFDVFPMFMEQLKRRSAKRTLNSYRYTEEKLRDFLLAKKKRTDIFLKEINIPFIIEFENFLTNTQYLQAISANKHTQRLKTVIKYAARSQFLEFNPLSAHERLREQKKEIVYLTEDELLRLEAKYFKIDRLSRIRDLFVFSCYTGLAYQEIKDLSQDNLERGIDGKLWLSYNRLKTVSSKGTMIKIPLLSTALEIIQRYAIDPEAVTMKRLLPVPSNQKFNAYLKEIADLCEIEKELTTHIARKTFATTVTLANDVPIETVAQALGHTDIKITQQYYAKVVPQKMARDMSKLERKLLQRRRIEV